jgi:c-di-GMP-related signal transduction protein
MTDRNFPLCGLQLLADHRLQPAAALFCTTPEALAELLVQPACAELLTRFPCFLAATDAAAQAVWQAAGGQQLVPARWRHCDDLPLAVSGEAGDWIAGAWYRTPPARPTMANAGSRGTALQLLQLVNDDAETHAIEELFRHDPVLSYQLLRLVNSLAMGGSRRIDSFAQAILILGRQQLRRWLNLLLFATDAGDRRAAMLLAQAALRARACELLAHAGGHDRAGQEHAFMTGMFSLLGVLFGMPLPELLAPLQLAPAVRAALAGGMAGEVGELGLNLQLVQALEEDDVVTVAASTARLGLAPAQVVAIQLQAWLWMLDILNDVPRS